jgi:hypothetical protein
MASITKHLDTAHGAGTRQEGNFAEREGHSLRTFHSWLHEEYENNPSITHSHDEHGQILFHDRRGE